MERPGQSGPGAEGGLCLAALNKGTKPTARGLRSPGERALVCRRWHAPFLLPHAPQPASAGLLRATGRARLGSTGLVRLLRPGASRERGWIRLQAANPEAGRGVTGLAGSRAAGLAVGSFLGPGPGLALRPRQDAEGSTQEAGSVGSTGGPRDPDSTLRRDGSAAQGLLDSIGFRSWGGHRTTGRCGLRSSGLALGGTQAGAPQRFLEDKKGVYIRILHC